MCAGAARTKQRLTRERTVPGMSCRRCGTRITADPKQTKRNRNYCSQGCYQAHRAEAGRVDRVCEFCGEAYSLKRSVAETTGQRFCSRKCAWSALPRCPRCKARLSTSKAAGGGTYCSDRCELATALEDTVATGAERRAQCSSCGEVKRASEFHEESNKRNKLASSCKACAHEYYSANKEAFRRRGYRYRSSGGRSIPFSAEAKAQRWTMWGGRCWICGIAEASCEDHVKPVIAGGWDCLANLRPICVSCNARKRAEWPLVTPAFRFHGYRRENPAPGIDPGLRRVGRAAATCQWCGGSWETQAHRAAVIKYCSPACLSAGRSATTAARRFGERTCANCGKCFEAKTSRQRFCRPACQLSRQRTALAGQQQLT